MKGIVLISHGDMAKGMAQAATMFFGEGIPQLTYCGLQPEDSPEAFAERIQNAIGEADAGDGVILLADLFGGTPCNQAILQLNGDRELIAGMNFPLLLELLSVRDGADPDIGELVEKGQVSLLDAKAMLAAAAADEDDE